MGTAVKYEFLLCHKSHLYLLCQHGLHHTFSAALHQQLAAIPCKQFPSEYYGRNRSSAKYPAYIHSKRSYFKYMQQFDILKITTLQKNYLQYLYTRKNYLSLTDRHKICKTANIISINRYF